MSGIHREGRPLLLYGVTGQRYCQPHKEELIYDGLRGGIETGGMEQK